MIDSICSVSSSTSTVIPPSEDSGASREKGSWTSESGRDGSSVTVLVVVLVIVGILVIGLLAVMATVIMYLRKKIAKLENIEMHTSLIDMDVQSITQD